MDQEQVCRWRANVGYQKRLCEEIRGYQEDAHMMAKNGEFTDSEAKAQIEAFQVPIESLKRLLK